MTFSRKILLSPEEVCDLVKIFSEGNFYQKIMREAFAREGIIGEIIKTIIDGEVETVNSVKTPSMIVTGIKGEQIILSNENFETKYQHIEGNRYKTKPDRILAVKIKSNVNNFEFLAPWNEKMIAHPGDYIVCRSFNDIYRVEKEIFEKTYKLCR